MIAMPERGQVVDDLVDIRLGADVDAPGGLVEDQHGRLGVEPLGEHRLLLVAARQQADGLGQPGGADVELLPEPLGGGRSAAPVDQPEPSRRSAAATAA